MFSNNQTTVINNQPVMNFNSNENKGLLWKTLSDNGLFSGIDSTRFADVKQTFEQTVQEIYSKTNNNLSITIREQNQLFVDKMITNLGAYKNNEVYTVRDIKNKRKTEFDNELEAKQRDFDMMMKRNPPQNIDFSDQPQNKGSHVEEKLENIDALLAIQQKERNKDLFSSSDNNMIATNENISLSTTPIDFSQNEIHASNINTEINNNLLEQLLSKINIMISNQEEIKELIRIRKKKSNKSSQ